MIIEHRVFRLAPGVTDDEFLAADRRVQTEVAVFAPGFVRRTTAKSDDGRWLVETLWDSEADADAALRAGDEVSAAFASMIEPKSESVERFRTLD